MLCEKLTPSHPFLIPHKQNCSFYLHNIALDRASMAASLYLIIDQKQILIAQLSRDKDGVKSINMNLEFNTQKKIYLQSVDGVVHIIGTYKAYFGANTNYQNNKKPGMETTVNEQRMVDQKQHNQQQTEKHRQKSKSDVGSQNKSQLHQIVQQPLRRSSRARAPAKPIEVINPKAQKRQKQQLKYMASIFNFKENQLDEDEDQDESFDKQDGEEEDDDEDSQDGQQEEDKEQLEQIRKQGIMGRKKKPQNQVEKQKSQNSNTTKQIQSQNMQQIPKKGTQQPSQHFPVPTRNPYV